jgi:hypothetical protein
MKSLTHVLTHLPPRERGINHLQEAKMNTGKLFKFVLVGLLALAIIASANPGKASGPSAVGSGTAMGSSILFQGKIKTTYTGNCDMVFSLWDASLLGSQVGSDIARNRVPLAAGSFSQVLDFGAGAFNGDERWIETEARCPSALIGVFKNYGRTKLEATAYAQYALNASSASDADTLDGSQAGNSADNIPLNNGTLNINLNSDLLDGFHASTFWMMGGNTVGAESSLGTLDNYALNFVVNGNRGFRIEANPTSPNIIGGSSANSVSPGVYGAVIGGGGDSGAPNVVQTSQSTICGGVGNVVSGSIAFIGGGNGNTATQRYTTVGGGTGNNATLDFATVGGGVYNDSGGYASVVAGGYNNTASGYEAAVTGGVNNSATQTTSVVSGGANNTASGSSSTVPGGFANLASGTYSFAAGYRAKANHNGAFVWADSTSADFASLLTNEFAVRANGGVRLVTGGIGATIDGGKVWHAGNDGSGSLLDADRVDGYSTGSSSGYIPINNGSLNNNLNADLLDGLHASDFSPTAHTHWGQMWSGSGTGLTVFGGSIGFNGSGSTIGVYGNGPTGVSGTGSTGVSGSSNNSGGYGVYGNNTSSGHGVYGSSSSGNGVYGSGVTGVSGNGSAYGIYGTSPSNGVYGVSTSGYGVSGNSTSNSGVIGTSSSGTGVYGTSSSMYGVFGNGTTGVRGQGGTYGLYGAGSTGVYGSGAGTGVYGTGTTGVLGNGSTGVSGSGTTQGVYGTGNTYGVYGISTGGTGVSGNSTSNVGVSGSSSSNFGVSGYSSSSSGVYGNGTFGVRGSGGTYGVYGNGPTGVYGTGTVGIYGTGSSQGVWGNSTDGYGVYGISTNSHGVFGISTNADGIYGEGLTGVSGWGSNYGVRGNSGEGYGVYGNSSSGYGVVGNAPTGVYGLGITGVYGSGTNFGLYGYSANDTGVYGYGNNYGVYGQGGTFAGYFNGNVHIAGDLTIGGAKAAVVKTKDYGTRTLYAVESPESWFEDFGTGQLVDGIAVIAIEPIFAQTVNLVETYHVFLTPHGNCLLYIAAMDETSFTVQTDDITGCDIAFDYRIVAKRLGYESVRLEEFVEPEPPVLPDPPVQP